MNPEDQSQNPAPAGPATVAPPEETVPPQATPAPGLGVTPAPADQAPGQPAMPAAAPASGDKKSKLPFLIGVGLVVIVLIAAIVFLAL